MDSFLLFLPDCGFRNHLHVAVVGNCLQEVSPLCLVLLDISAVRKQPLLFIVWALRVEEVGRCCGEREVKSVFRNVPGQASGGLSPDDWEGILGRGKPGNPVHHLQFSPSM